MTSRAFRAFSFVLFIAFLSSSAQAQSTSSTSSTSSASLSSGPSAEPHILDLAFGVWAPHAEIVGAAEGNGIPGTMLDYRKDLGLTNEPFANFDVTYLLAAHHKVRFQYSPVRYTMKDATLPRDVVFRGAMYPQGTTVTSTLRWQAYHLGYEYDFLVKRWGFVGAIFDVYRTDVQLRMKSAVADEVAASSVATVPTGGAIARVYATDWLALTAQFKGFKMPDKKDREYGGHLYDFEVSGLARLSRHLGAEVGFRKIDIRHLGKSDTGTMKMNGVYASAVVSY